MARPKLRSALNTPPPSMSFLKEQVPMFPNKHEQVRRYEGRAQDLGGPRTWSKMPKVAI